MSSSIPPPADVGDAFTTATRKHHREEEEEDAESDGEKGSAAKEEAPPPSIPPPYDGSALAVNAFGDPYFYNDAQEPADACRSLRKKVLGNKTVDQVREELRRQSDEAGAKGARLAASIGAAPSRLKAYFAAAADVEELLDKLKVVPLGNQATNEHELFKKRKALPLPSLEALLGSWNVEATRESKLCLVTGSSGSGKTFFALKYLPDFRWDLERHRHRVTVYLRFAGNDMGVGAGQAHFYESVVGRIRNKLGGLVKRPIVEKLRMHVCLIFDEAGDLILGGAFENRDFLHGLCRYLEEHLAESVVVVVSGTGITGASLNSAVDAFFFRVKPWQQPDVVKIMEQLSKGLNLQALRGTTIEGAVQAIFEHPELRALTTNARSAYFLVTALTYLCSYSVAGAWRAQLDAWAPALATRVMHDYIAGNGLRAIELDDRRIIAACVFQALEETKSWRVDTVEAISNYLTPPAFAILDNKHLAMARSLVTWNVDLVGEESTTSSGGVVVVKKKLVLVKGENRALSVTPAIAMVLFVLSGVQFSLIRGWKGEEVVAAMYVARQRILSVLKSRTVADADDWNRLRDELGKICLFELRKQIQPLRELAEDSSTPSQARVCVPLVSPSSILLNGEKASFANVIAPYVLVQAKHTKGTTVSVDIEEELRKCCLLTTCQDKRVLRGLLAVWLGDVAVLHPAVAPPGAPSPVGLLSPPPHDLSPAYPENLVKYGDPVDPVEYAFISSDGSSMSCEGPGQRPSIDVPAWTDKDKITFIISTNAQSISLMYVDDTADSSASKRRLKQAFIVTPGSLTQDLELDVSQLKVSEKVQWESFTRNVESWVKIKFLFTASKSEKG